MLPGTLPFYPSLVIDGEPTYMRAASLEQATVAGPGSPPQPRPQHAIYHPTPITDTQVAHARLHKAGHRPLGSMFDRPCLIFSSLRTTLKFCTWTGLFVRLFFFRFSRSHFSLCKLLFKSFSLFKNKNTNCPRVTSYARALSRLCDSRGSRLKNFKAIENRIPFKLLTYLFSFLLFFTISLLPFFFHFLLS